MEYVLARLRRNINVEQRQTQSSFDPKSYYTLYNDVVVNKTLSSGQRQDAAGAINMTIASTFSSSENWQIYYQAGRYFIRNYDYGAGWQLGLDSGEASSVPKLMKASGALGQQWTLTNEENGKWSFTNGLRGNSTFLALTVGNTVPGMQASKKGALWDIVINPSAGTPSDPGMLKDTPNFEIATSTSTSMSGTSATAFATSTSVVLPPSAPANHASQPLHTGAIAGIAVGGVAVLFLCGILVWFFCFRQRKSRYTGFGAEGKEISELSSDSTSRPAESWPQAPRSELESPTTNKVAYAHTKRAELE